MSDPDQNDRHDETTLRVRELIMEGLASGPGQLATPELFAEIRDHAMTLPLWPGSSAKDR